MTVIKGYGVEIDNSIIDYGKVNKLLKAERKGDYDLETEFMSSLIELDICGSFITLHAVYGTLYAVYEPVVPWLMGEDEKHFTEEDVITLLYKTVNKFTNDEYTIDNLRNDADFIYVFEG